MSFDPSSTPPPSIPPPSIPPPSIPPSSLPQYGPPPAYGTPTATMSYAAAPVGFIAALVKGLTVWTFKGRASRSEFWFWQLGSFLSFCLFWQLPSFLALFAIYTGLVAIGTGMSAGYIVSNLAGLFSLVVSIKVGVKRFHDSGKSGIHYSILVFGVVISIVIMFFQPLLMPVFFFISLLLLPVSFVWFLVVMCLPGKSAKNRYDEVLSVSMTAVKAVFTTLYWFLVLLSVLLLCFFNLY